MYKLLSLFVLVALVACVFAKEEVQDQEAAELYFRTYGYYPSWYSGYAYSGYPYSYGYNYGAYGYAGRYLGYY